MPEVSVGGIPKSAPKGPSARAPWWTLQAENQELKSRFAGVERNPPLRLGNYRRSEVLQAKMTSLRGILAAD